MCWKGRYSVLFIYMIVYCIFPSLNGFGTGGNSQGPLGSNGASWPPVVHCCHSFRPASNSPGLCDFINAPTGPKRCLCGQGEGRAGEWWWVQGEGLSEEALKTGHDGVGLGQQNLKVMDDGQTHLWVRKSTWGLSFLDFQKEFKKSLITRGSVGL